MQPRPSVTREPHQPRCTDGGTKAAFAIPPGPSRASGRGPRSSPEPSCASLTSQAHWEEGRCSAMLRDPLRPCRLLLCFSAVGTCTACSQHLGLMELLAAWHSGPLIIYLGIKVCLLLIQPAAFFVRLIPKSLRLSF